MFIWTEAEGAINVTDASVTAGDVNSPSSYSPFFELDGSGNPYVAWFEATGGAGADDVFAALKMPDLSYSVYLPVTRR